MAYRFDIMETVVRRDDESVHDDPAHPDYEPVWQFPAGALTAHSREGWELVTVQFETRPITSKFGDPRTERRVMSVWRRPIDEENRPA